MPPQNTPHWDPTTQRWITTPDPTPPRPPTPPPAQAQAPAQAPAPPPAPGQAPGYDPASGPPPVAPAPSSDPAPEPQPPASGQGHGQDQGSGPGAAPAPGSGPVVGSPSAPASGPGAASAQGYHPAPGAPQATPIPAPAPGYDPLYGAPSAPGSGAAPAAGYHPAAGPVPGYGPGAAGAQDAYTYPYPAYPHAQPGQAVPTDPPRGGGRWLTPTTAAVAVAALAIGAATVWFVARDSGEQPPPQAGPPASSAPAGGDAVGTPEPTGTPTPSATATRSPSPTGTGGSDTAHETVSDPEGFTIAVPSGWLREDGTAGVFYRSPDRAALVQIFQVSEPGLTPLAAVQGASTYLRAQTTGYQEIRVGAAQGAPEGGELVYEYDSAESHGRRRGVERVFVAQDGKKWAVLTAGPAGEWTLTQAHHKAALAAFRPAGG